MRQSRRALEVNLAGRVLSRQNTKERLDMLVHTYSLSLFVV